MKYLELSEQIRSQIEQMLKDEKWTFVLKEFQWMVRFKRGEEMINLYWNKKNQFKIATIIKHPKRGKNQMFRQLGNLAELRKFLKNPRQHSGKGYGSNKNKKGKNRRRK